VGEDASNPLARWQLVVEPSALVVVQLTGG
jgi:hypothetical protein